MQKVPRTMATQHPDNARAPYWHKEGKGFIGASKETKECVEAFSSLGIEEFMWDWEGKFTEEAVIDRLFNKYFDYFKKNPLGSKKRLTFRIPNIWQEKGYSLIRALMVILTSEDFARDIKFPPPLFEVILPMTENAKQLIFIQKSFQELAKLKSKMFSKFEKNTEYISIIPLFEGVDTQINAKKILIEYLRLHKKNFGFLPKTLRVFIARSDPAMVSGLLATVLANKIILSDLRELEKEYKIKIFPILGAGSLPFRGGLSPLKMKEFVAEYPSISTITIQSAFRYDFPLPKVKDAIREFNSRPTQASSAISPQERKKLLALIRVFEEEYRLQLEGIAPDMQFVFNAFPRRRERHLHIGLLAYKRKMNKTSLPRAITFTGSFYSLGIPPEFLGQSALAKLQMKDFILLETYYKNWKKDILEASKYVNRGNIRKLAKNNKTWRSVEQDVQCAEGIVQTTFVPKSKKDREYQSLSTSLLLLKKTSKKVTRLITKTGLLRRSLG